MAVTKLIVMYPMPKDMTAFERAYSGEHIPMAAPIFQSAGATKVELVDEWQVMRDPAGLLFCVIPAYDGALTEANSVAWP